VPQEVGGFSGGENSPATHRVNFQLRDGSIVDFQAYFLAIGENAAEDVMRGFEVTAWYLNELDLLDEDVLTFAVGRAGRFPDIEDGGPRWYGVLCDANAPELRSWLYTNIFKLSPAQLAELDIELFQQPGGRTQGAENLMNLTADYYGGQARTNARKLWYIARMIDNKPGFSREGRPVYADFSDTVHVSGAELAFVPGLALLIGLDAGLNPAAVFCQRMPNGQWRVIDELIGETGTGATRFGEMLARRLKDRYAEARTIRGYADPSAADGNDKRAGELSWIQIVESKAGIRIAPAQTNRLVPRIDAVTLPLTRMIDGQPGLLLSPLCVVLREGFNSSYRFRRVKPGVEEYHDEPEKNAASHPHDALQYVVMGGGEHSAVFDRKEAGARARRSVQHEHEWDPLTAGGA
jgi:hypothetical protein